MRCIQAASTAHCYSRTVQPTLYTAGFNDLGWERIRVGVEIFYTPWIFRGHQRHRLRTTACSMPGPSSAAACADNHRPAPLPSGGSLVHQCGMRPLTLLASRVCGSSATPDIGASRLPAGSFCTDDASRSRSSWIAGSGPTIAISRSLPAMGVSISCGTTQTTTAGISPCSPHVDSSTAERIEGGSPSLHSS